MEKKKNTDNLPLDSNSSSKICLFNTSNFELDDTIHFLICDTLRDLVARSLQLY